MTPSKRKYHIVSAIFLIFLYAGEDLVMADDVVTPSNPPFMPVEEEELEEALIDMNVSQRLRDEDPFRKVDHLESIIF